jgi:HK97 gp10 family phage protein
MMRVGRIRKEVLAAVTQAPTVKRQVRLVSAAIRDEARALAPVRTGALRRSITVTNVYDPKTRQVEYRVGWNKAIAFYGPMIEMGTEDTAPQPHLRPAALRVRGS